MVKVIKKFIATILYSLFCVIFLPASTMAVCPVCTVGVVAGLGLSRWLKIDDTVSGVWIGGVLASFSGMTVNWLKAKKINFFLMPTLVVLVVYASVVVPLYYSEIIGHSLNTLWGLDKLILGIGIGSILFIGGATTYIILKAKNNGRAHFPFEKIVLPITPLIIASIVFYYLTK